MIIDKEIDKNGKDVTINWTWPGIKPYMSLQIRVNNIEEGTQGKHTITFDFYTKWTNPATGYFTNEMDFRFYYTLPNGQTYFTPYYILKPHGVWAKPTDYPRSVDYSVPNMQIEFPQNADSVDLYLQYRSWIHTASRPETTDVFTLSFQGFTYPDYVTELYMTDVGAFDAEFDYKTLLGGTPTIKLDNTEVTDTTLTGLSPNTQYTLTAQVGTGKQTVINFTTLPGVYKCNSNYSNLTKSGVPKKRQSHKSVSGKWDSVKLEVYEKNTKVYMYDGKKWVRIQ